MAEIKILSYRERGVKIESVNSGIPINIFEKKGIPVAFKIEQNTTYLAKKTKVEFLLKDQIFIKENVIKNKKINTLLDSLKENFFSVECKIFSFFNEGELYIYDVYTNSNFFPYSDLIRISKEYKYDSLGFNVMKPVFSGYKTSSEALNFIYEYNKRTGKKLEDLFIMPAYPEFSSSTYFFIDEISAKDFEIKEEDVSEEIETTVVNKEVAVVKKETIADVEYIEDLSFFPEENDEDILTKVLEDLQKEYKQKDKDSATLDVRKKESVFTTIQELREKAKRDKTPDFKRSYQTAVTNIESCIILHKIVLSQNEKNLIDKIAFLWHTWSNVSYMITVQDFIQSEYGPIKGKTASQMIAKPSSSLGYVFYALWELYEEDELAKLFPEDKIWLTPTFLAIVLENEFYFYIQALTSRFYKEYH